MLNEKSIEAIAKASFLEKFKRPLYENYCFSRIPGTIYQNLVGSSERALPDDVLGELKKKYQKVIFIFFDSFGWRFLQPLLEVHPFLKHFVEKGIISQLTSQFPSTTAAHVTAMNTGLPVGEHGIYEWFYFEPEVDAVISPLKFCRATNGRRDSLIEEGFSPERLFQNKKTFYDELNKQGVNSFVLLPQAYARSAYGSVYCRGAEIVPYSNFVDIQKHFTQTASKKNSQTYHYLYIDQFDVVCHEYGPSSKEAHFKAMEILDFLQNLFLQKLNGKLQNSLLLMSADHGHMEVDPANIFFVDNEIPEIVPFLKTNQRSEPLVACGSSRDFFLHIKDNYLDRAQEILANKLEKRAAVLKVADLMKESFFGSKISELFLSRIANLVILPFKKEAVWWQGNGVYQKMIESDFGQHGGLSSQEMEIGFLASSME